MRNNSKAPKKVTILGQDYDIIVAFFANILSWFVTSFFPSYLPLLIPDIPEEDKSDSPSSPSQTKCVAIGRPGGKEQLRIITLKPGYATCGYNLKGYSSPFVQVSGSGASTSLPPQTVVVRVHSFSVNYADCCIRWGLYESANKFVGYPIVPGFDISGVIEQVSEDCDFKIGDKVFGATFFGAYSTRVLVPTNQLRKLPSSNDNANGEVLTFVQAAAIPSVSLTALYALFLGGQYPIDQSIRSDSNRSILIHSAAGGVGSMLVQMSKALNLAPVVGVVGRSSKIDAAKSLGCDVVIDKSSQDLWSLAEDAAPDGYAVVADANGISTLQSSYDHLAPTGRLIIFGFHTNLPMGQDMLHPMAWCGMLQRAKQMPKFDPMDLTASNKSLLGFNLSFFVSEMNMLNQLFDQIQLWLIDGKLRCPRVVEMDIEEIGAAHDLIQSGKSVGKIVIRTGVPL